jgi:hypothetical protein
VGQLLTLIALATIPTFFFESRSARPTSSGVGGRPSRSVRPLVTRFHLASRLTMYAGSRIGLPLFITARRIDCLIQ